MAAQKRRRGRADPDDFARGLDGEYRYTGPLYHYRGGTPYGRRMACLGAAVLCLMAAAAAAGCVQAAGMNGCFYVLLPYVGCVAAAVSVVWAAARLAAAGESLREYVYEATVLALPGRAALTAALAAAALAGEGVYLALYGWQGKMPGTLAYLALLAAALAACLALRRLVRAGDWQNE